MSVDGERKVVKFVYDLLAKMPGLRKKRSTVLLAFLSAIAGIWAEQGIHPSWCIAFVVVVYATDRVFNIVLLLVQIMKRESEHELKMKELQQVVDQALKLRGAAKPKSEDRRGRGRSSGRKQKGGAKAAGQAKNASGASGNPEPPPCQA
jgi:hypothetical protein